MKRVKEDLTLARMTNALFNLANARKPVIPKRHILNLVGPAIASQINEGVADAKEWKRVKTVDDPQMNEAQKRKWDKIKPAFVETVTASRGKGGARYIKAKNELVLHMMSLDQLSDEEQRIFFDPDFEGRASQPCAYNCYNVVQMFRTTHLLEEQWVRESPRFQYLDGLKRAIAEREERAEADAVEACGSSAK